jgi:DNA-binding response OmpR family regulator
MKSVLIVDDDNDLLKLYKQAFLNAHFLVDGCLTIPEAEELIKEKKYDIILLDILFPDRDIFSTIRLIRGKSTPNSETPILILTNLYYGDKTKKALELGANECLFKVTQTPSTIIKTVMRLAGNNHSQETG